MIEMHTSPYSYNLAVNPNINTTTTKSKHRNGCVKTTRTTTTRGIRIIPNGTLPFFSVLDKEAIHKTIDPQAGSQTGPATVNQPLKLKTVKHKPFHKLAAQRVRKTVESTLFSFNNITSNKTASDYDCQATQSNNPPRNNITLIRVPIIWNSLVPTLQQIQQHSSKSPPLTRLVQKCKTVITSTAKRTSTRHWNRLSSRPVLPSFIRRDPNRLTTTTTTTTSKKKKNTTDKKDKSTSKRTDKKSGIQRRRRKRKMRGKKKPTSKKDAPSSSITTSTTNTHSSTTPNNVNNDDKNGPNNVGDNSVGGKVGILNKLFRKKKRHDTSTTAAVAFASKNKRKGKKSIRNNTNNTNNNNKNHKSNKANKNQKHKSNKLKSKPKPKYKSKSKTSSSITKSTASSTHKSHQSNTDIRSTSTANVTAITTKDISKSYKSPKKLASPLVSSRASEDTTVVVTISPKPTSKSNNNGASPDGNPIPSGSKQLQHSPTHSTKGTRGRPPTSPSVNSPHHHKSTKSTSTKTTASPFSRPLFQPYSQPEQQPSSYSSSYLQSHPSIINGRSISNSHSNSSPSFTKSYSNSRSNSNSNSYERSKSFQSEETKSLTTNPSDSCIGYGNNIGSFASNDHNAAATSRKGNRFMGRGARQNDDSFLWEPTPQDTAIVHVSFELESDSDDDDDNDDNDTGSESSEYSASESDYSNSSTSSGSSGTNTGSSGSSSSGSYSGTDTRGVYTKANINQGMIEESGSEDGSSEEDIDSDSNNIDNVNNNKSNGNGCNKKEQHTHVEQDLNETSSTLDSFLLRICGGGTSSAVGLEEEEENVKMVMKDGGYTFEHGDYSYTKTDSNLARTVLGYDPDDEVKVPSSVVHSTSRPLFS